MNGWVLLDKPEGISSNKAMCIVRKLFGTKTGYVGTLDPFAQGLLPIAIGDACKFINYVDDSKKEYIFSIKFGEETDTLDKYGKVTNVDNSIPKLHDIDSSLSNFIGCIDQIPPSYSAIKINGRRAYKLALKGTSVNLPSRKTNIFSLEITSFQDNCAVFKCSCGKGTYIRSLARDICAKLRVIGHVNYLRRSKIKFLSSDKAISIENLEKRVYSDGLDALLSCESALDDIPALTLDDWHVLRLQNGLFRITDLELMNGQLYRIYRLSDGIFSGLSVAYDDCKLKPIRMIGV